MSKVEIAWRVRAARARNISHGCGASGAAISPCARAQLAILVVFLVLWEVLPRR